MKIQHGIVQCSDVTQRKRRLKLSLINCTNNIQYAYNNNFDYNFVRRPLISNKVETTAGYGIRSEFYEINVNEVL